MGFIVLAVIVYVFVVAACKAPDRMAAMTRAAAEMPRPQTRSERIAAGVNTFANVCLFLAGVVVLYGLLFHDCRDYIPWTRSVSVERVSAPHAESPRGVETAWR